MKNLLWPVALLILFTACNKKDAPDVVACVVDVALGGFQCNTVRDEKTFISFKDGIDLGCISPADIERFLKACKGQQLIPVNRCKLQMDGAEFKCEEGPSIPIEDADDFFCLSDKDFKSVQEKCLQQDDETLI